MLANAVHSPSLAHTETHNTDDAASVSQQTLSHRPSSIAFLVPRGSEGNFEARRIREGEDLLEGMGMFAPTRFLGLALGPLGSIWKAEADAMAVKRLLSTEQAQDLREGPVCITCSEPSQPVGAPSSST